MPFLGLIHDNADHLARDFYATLLQRAESHRYLGSAGVQDRLRVELAEWIRNAFSAEAFRDAAAFEARQQEIGAIHARMRIPVHLVDIGAARMCAQISDLVRAADAPWPARYDAMQLFQGWIAVAIAAMTRSGVTSIVNRTRLEEAYRLFSLDQDMGLERERQRSSLLEWSQSTLFKALHGEQPGGVPELASAPFGLWVRHRAEVMFESAPQLAEINEAVARIDTVLLPLVNSADAARRLEALPALGTEIDRVLALLGDLFAGLSELEIGRDPLTRTLNRRFLSSILLREIGFAGRTSMGLAGLMVDVDNFKSINDLHGHQAGDTVIRAVAGALLDNVRPADFVFRYGGEEFLILLVETGPQQTADIAERLRRAVAETRLKIGESDVDITVSIGAALHDGHPDPNELVNRADGALREAKLSGRDRVVIAAG